jgi:hypothetical protein
MLDALGYFDEIVQNDPGKLLEFSDWMGIPLDYYPVTLDRLPALLSAEVGTTGIF